MATPNYELSNKKKDKNQHIQVFVRVRPQNQTETYGRSINVVDVTSPKEVVVKERADSKQAKKFTFDRVFGPLSNQIDVYKAVVSPLIDEVLAGYNCTVFAYGQTGTGKTFTMEGHSNDSAISWECDSNSGIIPRALSHLFDELKSLESQEFTVRVSFLELYNEELFDLLSPNDDTKIRLYEDSTKRGTVIIHGLEEVTVHNKNEVYKILEKGSEKRQTAATLMNAQSSRSHTVFSITVHIKENTVEGEELLKTGKLNLVDLAGSENVGRSGAVDRRAREAGNINQSLLTLGRVITALVERTPHVPYRESKLTRLLQESLGGRTKTSIIATISPASINLEETLSTLDYAYRAKNITNRPEINQKLSKKALLKQYTEEIERLRRDLQATRERNGVYLAQDNYNEMQTTIEIQNKDIEDKTNHIKALEDTMLAKESLLNELKINLENINMEMKNVKKDRDENKLLLKTHVKIEKKLYKQAETLLKVADNVVNDTNKLHDKIQRSKQIESYNDEICSDFAKTIDQQFDDMKSNITNYSEHLIDYFKQSIDGNRSDNDVNMNVIDQINHLVSVDLVGKHHEIDQKLHENSYSSYDKYQKWVDNELANFNKATGDQCEALDKIATDFAPKIKELVDNEIKTNLQLINKDVNDNLNNFIVHIKATMEGIVKEFVDQHRSMKKQLEIINQNFDERCQSQRETLATTNELYQMVQMFTSNFNDKYKCLKSQHEGSINAISNDKSQYSIIGNELDSMLNHQSKLNEFVSNDVESNINDIKVNLTNKIDQNVTIAEESKEQSELLIKQFEKQINVNQSVLKLHRDNFESNVSSIKDNLDTNLSVNIGTINQLNELIASTNTNHSKLIENCRQNLSANAGSNESKFNEELGRFDDFNKEISSKIITTEDTIDQFLTKELKRVESTGLTPLKKDYQYPRKLIKTSPHEKILQKFKTESANINDILESSLFDDSFNDSLTANIVRSASVNDIASVPNDCGSPEDNSLSESEMYNSSNNSNNNNKENGIKLPLSKQNKISFIPKANANQPNGNTKRVLIAKNE